MLWRINKAKALEIGSGNSGYKGNIKGAFGVGIELIADEGDFVTIRVAGIQQVGDFERPVFFGASCAGCGLAKAG